MNSAVLSIGKVTDVGKLRSRNEDAMGVRRSETDEGVSLFVVADGMGGHSAGNVASQMAVEHVLESFFKTPDPELTERLRRSVEDANRKIYEKAQSKSELFRMGTTVVSTAVLDNVAYVANVGDSRAYLVRGDEIKQVTRDHSWVALQVEMGELTPEEALTSQNRSVLLRCLGEKPDVLVDIFRVQVIPGDILVMCSDGLHGQVTPVEIREYVQSRPPQQACDELMALANERGGPDNITVQAIRIDACSAATEDAASQPLVTFVEAPERDPAVRAVPGAAVGGVQGEAGLGAAAGSAPAPVYMPSLPELPQPTDPTPPLPIGPLIVAFLLGMLVTFGAMRTFRLGPSSGLSVPPSPSAEAVTPSPDLVIPGGVGLPASPSPGSKGLRTPLSPSPARPSGIVPEGRVLAIVQPPAPKRLVATARALYAVTDDRVYRCDLVNPVGAADKALAEVRLPPGKGVFAVAAEGEFLYVARERAILRFVGGKTTEPSATISTSGPITLMVLSSEGGGLYWVDEKGVIRRRTGDSARTEEVVVTDQAVASLAVTPKGEVFWASNGSGIFDVARKRLDVKARVGSLDADAHCLYWRELGDGEQEGRVYRCSFDGRHREVFKSADTTMAFAVNEGSIYWMVSEHGQYVIKMAPTQGSFQPAGS